MSALIVLALIVSLFVVFIVAVNNNNKKNEKEIEIPFKKPREIKAEDVFILRSLDDNPFHDETNGVIITDVKTNIHGVVYIQFKYVRANKIEGKLNIINKHTIKWSDKAKEFNMVGVYKYIGNVNDNTKEDQESK